MTELRKAYAAETLGRQLIAEHQREIKVSIRALRMLQEHYGNPYFSFKCVRDAEVAEWMAKAETEIFYAENSFENGRLAL